MSELHKIMIERLQEMIDIQCSDGNWNYDEYMHGMANGMIFAKSIFTDDEPEYLEAPDEWLRDISINLVPTER